MSTHVRCGSTGRQSTASGPDRLDRRLGLDERPRRIVHLPVDDEAERALSVYSHRSTTDLAKFGSLICGIERRKIGAVPVACHADMITLVAGLLGALVAGYWVLGSWSLTLLRPRVVG
jgi:hypothetical protein